MANDDLVIACSSGRSENTAIGLVRLTGFSDIQIFKKSLRYSTNKIKPRFSHLVKIIDTDNSIIDEALVVYLPKSSSYTGENTLELSVHGNQLLIDRVIKHFTSVYGATLAVPGEFTRRALKNKRLDLAQVEGLDLLLNATSPLMHKQGFDLLCGELHKDFLNLRDTYLKLKSSVELSIDFLDDVGEESAEENLDIASNEFSTQIAALTHRCTINSESLLHPNITLYGDVNAGKSSLFNTLLGTNRAIVSDIKGTTRDYISESITYKGIRFNIIDTAGIRTSEDLIEREGVRRTLEKIDESFFKILVINPFITKSISSNNNFDLLVFTHADNEGFHETINSFDLNTVSSPVGFISNLGPIGADLLNGPIEPDSKTGPMGAKSENGPIEPVCQSGPMGPVNATAILDLIANKYNEISKLNPILTPRHKDLISQISNEFSEFQLLRKSVDDIAVLSSQINIIDSKISELIGIISPDDVLSSIFSNFCIGK